MFLQSTGSLAGIHSISCWEIHNVSFLIIHQSVQAHVQMSTYWYRKVQDLHHSNMLYKLPLTAWPGPLWLPWRMLVVCLPISCHILYARLPVPDTDSYQDVRDTLKDLCECKDKQTSTRAYVWIQINVCPLDLYTYTTMILHPWIHLHGAHKGKCTRLQTPKGSQITPIGQHVNQPYYSALISTFERERVKARQRDRQTGEFAERVWRRKSGEKRREAPDSHEERREGERLEANNQETKGMTDEDPTVKHRADLTERAWELTSGSQVVRGGETERERDRPYEREREN